MKCSICKQNERDYIWQPELDNALYIGEEKHNMTHEQLINMMKQQYDAKEVQIFEELDLSWLLQEIGVTGECWRVWYSKEGVYIKDNKPYIFDVVAFYVDERLVLFPWKDRRGVSREQLMAQMRTAR